MKKNEQSLRDYGILLSIATYEYMESQRRGDWEQGKKRLSK